MRLIWKLVIAAAVLFVVVQFVRPVIPTKPATTEVQAPPAVRQILDKSCYSCHSDERRLSWFDQIEPGYWIVRHDILAARSHLDFSTFGSAPPAVQRAKLFEAVNMIQLGAMPLPQFVALHPDAKVTPEDIAELKAYLAPWKTTPGLSGSTTKNDARPVGVRGVETSLISLSAVLPEPNGLAFEPSFESWKPISTTDRGDNNTFRFILGNDLAVKAAQSGNISPWPDGAQFAKIAWQQELGADGLVHPGTFVQVELMVKDAQRYKDTDGWGWGRWRGLDLKPYGNDPHFVDECTGCHMPVRGNDYVYTLPITSARVNREEIVNNAAASLPASLPWQPLGWRAITMYVDPKRRTMATLYGNERAMQVVAPGDGVGTQPSSYPSGAVLALVTWVQRDDPHWFGGRIPGTPLGVEYVQISSDRDGNAYRAFEGRALTEEHVDAKSAAQRTNFILSLKPAPLP
jgi:mono/diheme cytochrome c family protein